MQKLIIAASLIAVAGIAGAASAYQGEGTSSKARYHTISGRTLVWHAPQEQPYALKGQQPSAKARQPRIEFQTHGRAGSTVVVHPQR